MLRQIWAITRNELKLAVQAPAQWALVVLTPIVFIAVMGSVFGATGVPTVAVYLVDEDGGRMSRQIISALLAGCAFPVDWLPPVLRTINVIFPQTWAMQGYQDLITRGMGFVAVLPEIAMLIGFAVVFFGLAVWRFDTGE